MLVAAVLAALAFQVTNGFHDAANAVAILVVTRAARPAQALALATGFTILGPLVLGAAVADTVGGIVHVASREVVAVVGAAASAAFLWNLVTWRRGLPSSSSHALVGGLVGAAVARAGTGAVRWGGFHGVRPVGVIGVLVWLAVSPAIGLVVGLVGGRVARVALRRATREVERPIRRGVWGTAAALAFSHGANDAQKAIGVITLLLVADGSLHHFAAPIWVKLLSGAAITVGTAGGGWRIARTLGSRIYRLRPLDGLVCQGGSAAVIVTAAFVGAPVSTTHVVAASIVGEGTGQRLQHVRWRVVREMGLAWLVTLPATAAMGAVVLPLWRIT